MAMAYAVGRHVCNVPDSPGSAGRGVGLDPILCRRGKAYTVEMKYIIFLSGLAVLCFLFVVSCKPSAEETLDSEMETTGQQTTRTETAVGDTTKDLEAYTYEQKTEFIASMEEELEDINRSIDELAARMASSSAEARAAATPRLDELRHQANLLHGRIDELKDATASTWDTVKATTRDAYDNLKQNFEDARQWMSDKTEL